MTDHIEFQKAHYHTMPLSVVQEWLEDAWRRVERAESEADDLRSEVKRLEGLYSDLANLLPVTLERHELAFECAIDIVAKVRFDQSLLWTKLPDRVEFLRMQAETIQRAVLEAFVNLTVDRVDHGGPVLFPIPQPFDVKPYLKPKEGE